MQLGHDAELEAVRQLAAQVARRVLQACLASSMREAPSA
jgi:hypothetical protein